VFRWSEVCEGSVTFDLHKGAPTEHVLWYVEKYQAWSREEAWPGERRRGLRGGVVWRGLKAVSTASSEERRRGLERGGVAWREDVEAAKPEHGGSPEQICC